MGLEEVKEDILDSAKIEAGSIISGAKKEAQRILREAEKKAQDMQEESDADAKKMIDSMKRQELAGAELESKKMLLEAKKKIVEGAFEHAKTKLEGMHDKKREELAAKILQKIKKEMDPVHIYCGKKDLKFIKGHNAEEKDMVGGIIAENKDRTIRIDCSYETILQSVKENEMQGINKILFE